MNNLFNSKNLPTIVNIVVFILLLFVAFFKKGDLSNLNGQLSFITDKVNSIEQMQRELAQKDTLISKIQTENQQIQTYLLRQYEIQTIKLNQQQEDFIQLQQRLKEIGVDVNNLSSDLSVTFEKIDSSVTNIIGKQGTETTDTIIKYTTYAFKDTSAHLQLDGNINVLDGKLFYRYKYNAKFDILTYYDKQGIFGKRNMYASLFCDDPNAEVSLKSIMIKQRRPTLHIGIGFGASMIYNKGFKLTPSISISLYKPLIDVYL